MTVQKPTLSSVLWIYRLIAQFVLWFFFGLIVYLIGINYVAPRVLVYFIPFTLLMSAIVVYPHYIWLLPILIEERKPVKYFLLTAFLISAVQLVVYVLTILILEDQHIAPTWNLFSLRFVSFIVLVGISSTWYFLEAWLKAQEKDRQQLKTELAFLKNQINPHFLFNALNNIHSLAFRNDPKVTDLIANLSDALRYLIYDCSGQRVNLEKEVQLIERYIAIQRITLGEEIQVRFQRDGIGPDQVIAPMILINFLENAFKHSDLDENPEGYVVIDLQANSHQIRFSICNTKRRGQKFRRPGIGLANTLRQLELHYPGKHDIDIQEVNHEYIVHLLIQTT